MSNTYWRVSKKPLPGAVWIALDQARSKRLRWKQRSFDTQEDGVPTPEEEQDDYFAPRPRLRRQFSSPSPVPSQTLLGPRGRRPQEEETAVREFLISTVALPDTLAIMVASMVSMWLQPELCRWQVAGGRKLCTA